ncbi:anti-sigma factor [Gloeocapsopsis crepidinum LEGE 06123]|uniref:Regulator of SigK n=1 Tax=Gloeocapsopsis crepidinum LEGE 06123 TaxID=588587 RepID=A0ABR9UP40_9CHRO|nr:anti-sigma factor [Gloeocapsopsis crepidinum]MBE9190053.1 anti-sigma factor [Gloeocapsopsis crepidinum LEGE 06123]
MVWSMPSEQLQLLIAGYVLGDLSPEEIEEFEQLLANDPAIAQEVAQMQKALEISYAPPEVAPPSHLRAAILEANKQQDKPLRPQSQRSFSWIQAMGVAAAVLVAALGISNYRLWQTLHALQTEVQQTEPLTFVLQAQDPNVSASATLTVDPSTLEAELNAQNLPTLPPGKVYALWTVLQQGAPFTTDDKDAVLTAVFAVDANGNASENIEVPQVYRNKALVTAVAITVEDASAPQRHEGAPVLIVKV